jgi:hypothetical protein
MEQEARSASVRAEFIFHPEEPMKRTSKSHRGLRTARHREHCRPTLEVLEKRLPPGDAVLGSLLLGTVAGESLAAPEPVAFTATTGLGGVLATDPPTSSVVGLNLTAAPSPHWVTAADTAAPLAPDVAAGSEMVTRAAPAGNGLADPALPTGNADPLAEANPFAAPSPPPLPRRADSSGLIPVSTALADDSGTASPDRPQPSGDPAAPGLALLPEPSGLPEVTPLVPSALPPAALTPTLSPPSGIRPSPTPRPPIHRVPAVRVSEPGSPDGPPIDPLFAGWYPDVAPDCSSCACSQSTSPIQEAPGVCPPDNPSQFSDGPVRYYDGTVKYSATDLSSSGFGTPWGQIRTWTNTGWYGSSGANGNSTVVTQQPYVVELGSAPNTDSYVAVITSGTNSLFFTKNQDGSYAESFYPQDKLVHDTTHHDYQLTDSTGKQFFFYDYYGLFPTAQRGHLNYYVDPYGIASSSTYDSGSGLLTAMQRTDAADGVAEQYTYNYRYLFSALVAALST